MHEDGRIIGLGLANVDYKVKKDNLLKLPKERHLLTSFLDKEIVNSNRKYFVCAGGSVSNIFMAFAELSSHLNFKLFCAIGNDERGKIYRSNTSLRLGEPQIRDKGETGFWIALLDRQGNPEGLSYHGVGDDVEIQTADLKGSTNGLFITDITSSKNPKTTDMLDAVLKLIKQDGGNFALSLGGARPNGITKDKLSSLFSSFLIKPQIVFGNEQEFLYTSGNSDIKLGLEESFSDARLLVVTLANKGTLIRFEGKTMFVPAISIPTQKVVDQIGAGDAYMGTMLAFLYKRPYASWDIGQVQNASKIARQAGAAIIQKMQSRLTPGHIKFLRHLIK
ncbi:MAG: carbohydrate kinase family protein [bacterium]|nr:carbohydrate kinase family protein [bacterium]